VTIDELARAAGTTTRQVRALQTRGLLPGPSLVGRTGYYDAHHLERLRVVSRLQAEGFSLAALTTLVRAWEAGRTLDEVLGLHAPVHAPRHASTRSVSEEEGDPFGDLAGAVGIAPRRGEILSLVPSTILDQAVAS
jgi:DNA-binding transcriptional MerR regulator